MSRLGFSIKEARNIWQELVKLPNIKVNALITHFYLADCLDKNDTDKQAKLFYDLCKDIPIPLSLSHSAGILGWPHIQSHWVRPGLMLYGISPFKNKIGSDFGLKPVMHFKSKIIAINHCSKGSSIGYGADFTCPKDMVIGVVACGYSNGYPRSATNHTPVLIRNNRVSLVGRVSMEMLTIDLSDIDNPQIGDEVLLWGEGLPIEEISSCSSISAYELITRNRYN
jgi:alanine racemase